MVLSKASGLIQAILNMKFSTERGKENLLKQFGHLTKMAAMLMCCENTTNYSFLETTKMSMTLKLGMYP